MASIPCRQKVGNGLAVPRHSDIPPPPVFPHSEDDTPGGQVHPSTGPSTGWVLLMTHFGRNRNLAGSRMRVSSRSHVVCGGVHRKVSTWQNTIRGNFCCAGGRWAADERPQMASRDLAYLRKRKLDMDSAFDAAHSPQETLKPQ